MPTLSQSSLLNGISAPDLLHALRFAPDHVPLFESPVLYYFLTERPAPGTEVQYRLVNGFHSLSWTGTVRNYANSVLQVVAPGSPLGAWSASHAFESKDDACIVRDSLSCSDERFEELFGRMQVAYSVCGRLMAEGREKDRATGQVPVWSAQVA
jgi:hypothetical protein